MEILQWVLQKICIFLVPFVSTMFWGFDYCLEEIKGKGVIL